MARSSFIVSTSVSKFKKNSLSLRRNSLECLSLESTLVYYLQARLGVTLEWSVVRSCPRHYYTRKKSNAKVKHSSLFVRECSCKNVFIRLAAICPEIAAKQVLKF
jgi:hypothetical protein